MRRRRDVRPVTPQKPSMLPRSTLSFGTAFLTRRGGGGGCKYYESILQDGFDVSDIKLTHTLTGYLEGFYSLSLHATLEFQSHSSKDPRQNTTPYRMEHTPVSPNRQEKFS